MRRMPLVRKFVECRIDARAGNDTVRGVRRVASENDQQAGRRPQRSLEYPTTQPHRSTICPLGEPRGLHATGPQVRTPLGATALSIPYSPLRLLSYSRFDPPVFPSRSLPHAMLPFSFSPRAFGLGRLSFHL
jgi:hypothetical protein